MRPLPLLILSGILFLSTTTLAQMKSLNANDTLAAANLSPKEFREIIADLKKSAFDIPQSFAIGDRQHPQRLGPHAHYGPPAPPNGLARPPWAGCSGYDFIEQRPKRRPIRCARRSEHHINCGCVYRKINPDIVVMKAATYRARSVSVKPGHAQNLDACEF